MKKNTSMLIHGIGVTTSIMGFLIGLFVNVWFLLSIILGLGLMGIAHRMGYRRLTQPASSLNWSEKLAHIVATLILIALLWLVRTPVLFIAVAVLVFLAIRIFESPHWFRANMRVRMQHIGLAIGGIILGGLIGFLLRPSAPLIGQLSFEQVITRGSNLQGLDQLLIATAETSFNYLLVGAILGGVIGIASIYLLSRRKETTPETERSSAIRATSSPSQTINQGDIAENLKKLAELKDGGIITEEEFQAKKTELLSRL